MSEEHSESESSTSTNNDIEVINIDEPVFHSDVEEESSVGEESGDERESVERDDEDDEESGNEESVESFDMNIVYRFIDYAMGYRGEIMTVDGIKERVSTIPTDILRANLLEYNVLHSYVHRSAPCQDEGGLREEGWPADDIELEVVQYLLELAPYAVYKVAEGTNMGAARREGALPLHLACFNADCPVSVIKLLLEKNPSAARYDWENGYGLPLCCYLQRMRKHPSWYGIIMKRGIGLRRIMHIPVGRSITIL